MHKIVIVGGGAGGLELASLLGKKFRKNNNIKVTLVDHNRTHIWKPLLHEVASGNLDPGEHQVEYLAQAHRRKFVFRQGSLQSVDRDKKIIMIAPTFSDEGEAIFTSRPINYDTLILGIGTISNDFNVPGVKDYCWFLDTLRQAQKFQRQLLERLLQRHAHTNQDQEPPRLKVTIIGGGATGIELAAQIYEVTDELSRYGLDEINPDDNISVKILEGSDRLLPALPDHIGVSITKDLLKTGVEIYTSQQVVEIKKGLVICSGGEEFESDVTVWAAGIKAPDILNNLGIETNKINQVVVNDFLKSVSDSNIYAIGDCADCILDKTGKVPPRAQAAHQMSSLVCDNIVRELKGKELKSFKYQDYGSLVSLGKYSTVGQLMGNITGSVRIAGTLARWVYLSLHLLHQQSLYGTTGALLLILSNWLRSSVEPKIKLH